MRIKHLFVSNYKNLKKFSLDFDGESFIDVFVGKNGSGKSNMFEALIEIFRHLYENDYVVEFDYKIQYIIGDNDIKIEWKWEEEKWLDEAGKVTKKVTQDKLPDNILIYYSGHNPKVKDLVSQYEKKFSDGLKGALINDSRKFIGIGNEYKSLLLTCLLLQSDDNKAKLYILEKLGIKSISPEFKIVLQRPQYAKSKPSDYQIDTVLTETNYWRAEGIVREFIDKLLPAVQKDPKGVRKEGYFKEIDQYIHYIDIKKFNDIFSDKTIQAIFRSFDNLKTLEMLENIGIEVTLNDKSEINIDHFSDGQFQSLYIYSIIELFKDRTCVTLLDEPDSFLHPEWQFKFLSQIIDIASQSSECNHVLMTSHSASTITPFNKRTINFFEIEGNTVKVNKYYKSDVIKTLSSGLITFTESEAKLNINHFLNNTSGAVLFAEGITDEMILETAWNKLNPNQKPNFEIQNAYSCAFLRNTIKDETLYARFPNKIFFSIFDFDEAFNDWSQLGAEIESNPVKCLTRKYKTFESYSMLLPVNNLAISNQVLNLNTGKTFGNRSLLTIELMFFGVPSLDAFFVVDLQRTDGFMKFISDGQKVKFAADIVPGLDAAHFEVFRPIFDFIKSKIN